MYGYDWAVSNITIPVLIFFAVWIMLIPVAERIERWWRK